MMTRQLRSVSVVGLWLGLFAVVPQSPAAENPFVGHWELTFSDGRPGWLGVDSQSGGLSAEVLLGNGSVLPGSKVRMHDETLSLEVVTESRRGRETVALKATCRDGDLALTLARTGENGATKESEAGVGRRSPPLPPRPDLSRVQFGSPIRLLDAPLDQTWQLVRSEANVIDSPWTLENGVLTYAAEGAENRPTGHLRTKAEYGDFRLTTDVMLEKGCNSGLYLRGLYEIQVVSSLGKPHDSHNMGAVYSRITPSAVAEKPPGEWQTLEITLVDRHVTVTLNGTTIIDNQPVPGCTGGALSSDVSRPGPLMLQKHGGTFSFRNMELRPILDAASGLPPGVHPITHGPRDEATSPPPSSMTCQSR